MFLSRDATSYSSFATVTSLSASVAAKRIDFLVLAVQRVAERGADCGADDEADRAARDGADDAAGTDTDRFLFRRLLGVSIRGSRRRYDERDGRQGCDTSLRMLSSSVGEGHDGLRWRYYRLETGGSPARDMPRPGSIVLNCGGQGGCFRRLRVRCECRG